MTTTMLTPVDRGNARPSGASRLWRKQLLPLRTIDYKGRKIEFDREYLAGLVKAFTDRCYDQVPFQLAPAGNEHTNDPERFRGEIRGLEMTGDGLDVIVAATEDGDRVLRQNPALGVSARISEDYQRSDGRFFPAAIQHVLGTLDPRIPGMRGWRAIEAANDDGEVIDLTALEYDTQPGADEAPATKPADPGASPVEEHAMALTADQEARLAKLLDLPQDQFDALLTPVAAEPEGDDDGDTELTDAELQELLDSVPEGDADATEGDQADTEPELVSAGAQLSAEAQAAIDLANARADETSMQLAHVRRKLDTAAYEAERDTLARVHGIPPRITDLARTLLEGEGRTVDLANGKTADAGAIVRKMLAEVGRTVRMLDLSAELGTAHDGGDDTAAKAQAAAEDRAALVARYRQTAGI